MGGRAVRRLVVAVVVLLALLAVADRVGVVVAEHAAGNTIQTSQHLPSRPDVDIAGFPFLTQLATGKYEQVTLHATDVPIGRPRVFLTLSRIAVVLHNLTVSRDFSSLRAKTATATAVIDYAELGHLLDARVSYAGGGRLAVHKAVSIAGHSIGGTLSVRPQFLSGALTFAGASLLAIPLRGIPFNIRVTTLQAAQQGIVLGLAGRDLAYHS